MNEENVDEIPLGIILSMILYAIYAHILEGLIREYNIDVLIRIHHIDNWAMPIIYFLPLVILYIEIPILLRKYKNLWQNN